MFRDYIVLGVNFGILDLSEGMHNLCLRFNDPNSINIASIEDSPMNYAKDSSSNLPKEYLGINVAANFQNVDIKCSGMYSMNVILDGIPLGTYEIFVKGKNESA